MTTTTFFRIDVTRAPLGFGKASVRAVETDGLSGVYCERTDRIIVPDLSEVRLCLPSQWRKAFDRAGRFWTVSDSKISADGRLVNQLPCGLTLNDRKGRYLTSIYATPYHFTPGPALARMQAENEAWAAARQLAKAREEAARQAGLGDDMQAHCQARSLPGLACGLDRRPHH